MGTIQNLFNEARTDARDKAARAENAFLLSVCNDELRMIRRALVMSESVLLIEKNTISIVAATREYTPSFSFDSFVRDYVFLDGFESSPLVMITEPEMWRREGADGVSGQPDSFYIAADKKIGFSPLADDAYTCIVNYFVPYTDIATADIALGNLGTWQAIFYGYLKNRIAAAIVARQGRDNASLLASAILSRKSAFSEALRMGTVPRRARLNMMTARGL